LNQRLKKSTPAVILFVFIAVINWRKSASHQSFQNLRTRLQKCCFRSHTF